MAIWPIFLNKVILSYLILSYLSVFINSSVVRVYASLFLVLDEEVFVQVIDIMPDFYLVNDFHKVEPMVMSHTR